MRKALRRSVRRAPLWFSTEHDESEKQRWCNTIFRSLHGVRNGIFGTFNPLPLRNDDRQLCEHDVIMERVTRNEYKRDYPSYSFWRMYDKKEIDFVEDRAGVLHGHGMK